MQATEGFGRIALSSYIIHYNYTIKCSTSICFIESSSKWAGVFLCVNHTIIGA